MNADRYDQRERRDLEGRRGDLNTAAGAETEEVRSREGENGEDRAPRADGLRERARQEGDVISTMAMTPIAPGWMTSIWSHRIETPQTGRPSAACRHFEPVDAAMADADAIDVEGLGNDHEIGPSLRNPPDLRKVRHAGKAAALFVHRAADFQRPRQPHARARDRFSREHRRRDTGLHVADAAAVDLPVPHETTERIDRPAFARRDDIDVAVEVNDRSRASAPGADDIHARIPRRVLGPSFGGDVLDVELAPLQEPAEEIGARAVVVAGRIDRRNADEIDGERDDFVRCAVDFREDALDG